MQKRAPIIVILVGIVIGGGLSYYLARMVAHERGFEAEAQRSDGVVIGFKERQDARLGTTYAPVFRFTTEQGQTLERPSREATRPVAWSVGERAVVMFDPREPTYVVADTWRERWGVMALLAFVAATFFAAAALSLRTRLTARRMR